MVAYVENIHKGKQTVANSRWQRKLDKEYYDKDTLLSGDSDKYRFTEKAVFDEYESYDVLEQLIKSSHTKDDVLSGIVIFTTSMEHWMKKNFYEKFLSLPMFANLINKKIFKVDERRMVFYYLSNHAKTKKELFAGLSFWVDAFCSHVMFVDLKFDVIEICRAKERLMKEVLRKEILEKEIERVKHWGDIVYTSAMLDSILSLTTTDPSELLVPKQIQETREQAYKNISKYR